MTNATGESASARVCPRCGEKAKDQPFCGGCGLNLAQQVELPDAEEYAARLREEQWLRTQQRVATPSSQDEWKEPGRSVAQRVANEAAQAPLAGWWVRAGAIVIDTLVLVIPWAIIGFLFGPLLGALVNVGLWFGYFMLMVRDAQNGQSLGMQAVGIRVRREDGKPVDAQTVAMRQLLMQGIVFGLLAFLIVPYLLNYLWPLWDRENRALHDTAAKTRVVRA